MTTQFADIVFDQIQRKIQATTKPPTGDTVFVLSQNNCTVREPCGVCGQSHKDAENPAWLFSRSGTLCGSCAEELAPALYRAARALAVLYWLGDGDGQDREIVKQAYFMLPTPGKTDWDNPPSPAEVLRLLDVVPVRARIDELWRLEAEGVSDDFGDHLPF